MESMLELVHHIVDLVGRLGYFGIFIMTFIESTFIPIPAEITMIPAGYLVHQGQMNGWIVMVCAITGTIGGSLFNYWLAYRFGRMLLLRHPKIFMISPQKLDKMERFFADHGEIATFTGRLIPGLRHYISFPAGLARMRLRMFCLYTGLGGGLWMGALLGLGYFIGENETLMKQYLTYVFWGVAALGVLMVLGYVWRHRRRVRRAAAAAAAALEKPSDSSGL